MKNSFIVSKTSSKIQVYGLLAALLVLPGCVTKETEVVHEQPILTDVEIREIPSDHYYRR